MEPKDYQYPRMEVRGCRARGSSFRGWRLWSQRLRVSENRGLGEWSPRASKVRGGGARGSSLRGQRLRVSEDRGLGEWSPRALEVRGFGARGSSLPGWRLWGHRVWGGNLQYPTHNMNYGFFFLFIINQFSIMLISLKTCVLFVGNILFKIYVWTC